MAIFVNSLKVARKNRLEELHISFQILSMWVKEFSVRAGKRKKIFSGFIQRVLFLVPFLRIPFSKRCLIMQTTLCYSQILSLRSDYANITLNKILHPTRFYTSRDLEALTNIHSKWISSHRECLTSLISNIYVNEMVF